jgi:hypothetical protein
MVGYQLDLTVIPAFDVDFVLGVDLGDEAAVGGTWCQARRVPMVGHGESLCDVECAWRSRHCRGHSGLRAGVINLAFYTTLVMAAVLTSQTSGAWLEYALRQRRPLLSGEGDTGHDRGGDDRRRGGRHVARIRIASNQVEA